MSPSQLRAPLLDFERLPGRYALARREPAILFEQAHTVLQLAAGRPVDGLDAMGPSEQAPLRRAARFFVRTAFLRQGADHYTLLGLKPDADGEQLREHYRLMIRMTHPDFEVGGEHWPPDSAARINIAKDVLASAVRRREYDESLQAAEPAPVTAAPAPVLPVKAEPPRPRARARAPWGLSTKAKSVLAGVGAVVCLGALVTINGTGNGSLTARQRTVGDDTAAYAESGFTMFRRSTPADPAPPQDAPPSSAKAATGREHSAAAVKPTRSREQPAEPKAVAKPAKIDSAGAANVGAASPSPEADARPETPALQLSRQMGSTREEPAPMQTVKAEPAELTPVPPPPRLTIQAVHPLMTNVLASLSAGRGENLAQWIAPEWRSRSSNQAFVAQFNQWLGGQRVRGVSKVALNSQPQGDTLVVDGVVQLEFAPSLIGEPTRNLRLRAYFKLQDGQPVLTQLTASEPQ